MSRYLLSLTQNGEQLSIFDVIDGMGTIGCLALIVMWLRKRLATVQSHLDDCESDREELHVKCTELETTMRHIEKKIA